VRLGQPLALNAITAETVASSNQRRHGSNIFRVGRDLQQPAAALSGPIKSEPRCRWRADGPAACLALVTVHVVRSRRDRRNPPRQRRPSDTKCAAATERSH